jgi:hypothetical protein
LEGCVKFVERSLISGKHGRKKEYTVIGIKRVPCFRCGRKPSYATWNICCDNNLHRPLCLRCDIAMNLTWLLFMGVPNWKEVIEAYIQKKKYTLTLEDKLELNQVLAHYGILGKEEF